MAAVYLGRDLKHDRAVAVKVLRPELGALLGAERFLREIKVVARLQHPHILPLYDSGEADGTLYYVMPYVPGDSLRDRIRRERRLPLRDALRVAREVADALYYAHSNDIVHRDIKPENILLSGSHAVVADFGIARAVHAAGGERWETLTDSGVAVGTPAYMSPEQTAGEHDLDGRSDIFSLGCVVYEMLAGVPPFTGPDGEVMIAKRFTDPAPILRAVREDVPESVDLAVQRALAKEPAERFANALEFTDAIWDDTGAIARVQRNSQRSAERATSEVGRSTVVAPPARAHRHAALRTGGFAMLGAAVLVALWFVSPLGPLRSATRDAAAPAASPASAAAAGARTAGDSEQRVGPAGTVAGSSVGSASADSTPGSALERGAGEATAPVAGRQKSGTGIPGVTAPGAASIPPTGGAERGGALPSRSVPQRVAPEPQARVPVPTGPRTDSVLTSLRAAARDARNRAVSAGATQTDLSRGDSLERAAEASAAGGQVAEAITQLMSASTAWTDGARAARSRAAQASTAVQGAQGAHRESTAAAARPSERPSSTVKTAEESVAAAPSLADQRAAIGAVIVSYGRAIEAGDLSAIRKLYPNVTAAQQRDWQQFFSAVQNIKVSLSVAQLDITGTSAEARITGSYKYLNTSARRLEEQPVSFQATLQRDGALWRLTAIR
jgi:hypothetical protein